MARASLDELLLDYEDFLRQRKLSQWAKDSPEAGKVRQPGKRTAHRTNRSDSTEPSDHERWSCYAPWLEHQDPGVVANTLICLIHQANHLLDRQIAVLERGIIEQGGYREQLTAARLAERDRKAGRPAAQAGIPACPRCGNPMRQRTARRGKHAGTRFWGCSGYPDCKGIRPLEE